MEVINEPRSGRPPIFTAEQLCQLDALAGEEPAESALPINRWTPSALANELVKRNIVASISPRHVGRLLDTADLKPHSIRYWHTPQPDEHLSARIEDISRLYRQALRS